MPSLINTNIRSTLIEGININQGRDFSDASAGHVDNLRGFVDKNTHLVLTPSIDGNIKLSSGSCFVKYNKTSNGHFMKCEMIANQDVVFTGANGTYFLYIKLNQGLLVSGSATTTGSDMFTIEYDVALPVTGFFCALYRFTVLGSTITIVTDLREKRSIVIKKLVSEVIESETIVSDSVEVTNLTIAGNNFNTAVANSIASNPQSSANILSGLPVMTGEALTTNQATFIESYPTATESTIAQNIGDVTANTRVAPLAFSSGFNGSTITFKLGKTLAPSPSLEVRFESDNNGNPSGNLIHANGVGTITPATISGIAVYTITLAGVVTILRGVKFHIVLRQVGDVVNASNFYSVYGLVTPTYTRQVKKFNGTVWSKVEATISFAPVNAGNTTVNVERGFIFTFSKNIRINSITRGITGTRATRLFIRNMNDTLLFPLFTFSGDTFTFPTPLEFKKGDTIKVRVDNNGANYTYPVYDKANVLSTNGILSTGAESTPTVGAGNPGGISSMSYEVDVENFIFTSSTIIEKDLLSLTDATDPKKTTLSGLSSTTYTAGQDAVVKKIGEVPGFSGLTQHAPMFLDSIRGGLTTVDKGTLVGYNKNSTTLILVEGSQLILSTISVHSVATIAGAIPPGTTTNGSTQNVVYTAPATGYLSLYYYCVWTRGSNPTNSNNYGFTGSITISSNSRTITIPTQSELAQPLSTVTTSTVIGEGKIDIFLAKGQQTTIASIMNVTATNSSSLGGSSSAVNTLTFTSFNPL